MNLLEEIKADYNLCIYNPQEYQRKVNSISDLFSIKAHSNSDYRQIEATGSQMGKLKEMWRIFNSNDHLRKAFFES